MIKRDHPVTYPGKFAPGARTARGRVPIRKPSTKQTNKPER